MKIFAIRDEAKGNYPILGYLLYYESEKRFYIELPKEADIWQIPLLLDNFARRGETTINSYWSKIWVQQRIIPPDRQNLGQILKDNGLEEYDEFKLLTLAKGRCAQDDYFLEPMEEQDLPKEILQRLTKRIEDVVPLDNFSLLVFFRDSVVKKCCLKNYFEKNKTFHILLNRPDYFAKLNLEIGGYGVEWDWNIRISDTKLYELGIEIPLNGSDFKSYVIHNVLNAQEACELLDCSRQNINQLTKNGRLHPLKISEKNTLYLKSEVMKRKWH